MVVDLEYFFELRDIVKNAMNKVDPLGLCEIVGEEEMSFEYQELSERLLDKELTQELICKKCIETFLKWFEEPYEKECEQIAKIIYQDLETTNLIK